MDKLVCPKCGEILADGAGCRASGVITCDECNYQMTWECDGKKTISK